MGVPKIDLAPALHTIATATMTIETCEQEAIHTPNIILAHGAVLVADASSHLVTHAASGAGGRPNLLARSRVLKARRADGKAIFARVVGEE